MAVEASSEQSADAKKQEEYGKPAIRNHRILCRLSEGEVG